jgi:glycerophosphoryl diester phosphodiesterase
MVVALAAVGCTPWAHASEEELAALPGPVRALEVQGHRGARAARPENTLAAFRYALDAGVDVLELDLGVTKDGVLIVQHEQIVPPALCRGPDGAPPPDGLALHALTLAQVQSYDCGSVQHPDFPQQVTAPGERMPTFEEVLDLIGKAKGAAASRVQLNVETKIDPAYPDRSPDPETFARMILDALRRRNLLARATLQSFDPRTLIAARKLDPNVRLSFLIGRSIPADFEAQARALRLEVVSPRFALVDRAQVDAWHAAGFRVIPWTVDIPDDWRDMVVAGVDGIITDDPKGLIDWLRAHKRR